jgi:4-hydroxy-tetrahydrodipicolinate reductase
MKLLLIGYGRMGRLVEALAPEYGWEIAGVLDASLNRGGEALGPGSWHDVEVAIDFSTADAVVENLPRLAALGKNVVIGTTGWQADRPRLQAVAEQAGIGVLAAPNFSTGMVIFGEIVKAAARLLGPRAEYGAWLHELHHDQKKDSPSGTALALKRMIQESGYPRPIDVAATRAGSIPGTHTVGFDAPSETVTLTHAVRDRGTFARGALVAATWLRGRHGWYSMHDCLGLNEGGTR